MKFRKKPVVVDAMQFTGDNVAEIHAWSGSLGTNALSVDGAAIASTITIIPPGGGQLTAAPGDWFVLYADGMRRRSNEEFSDKYEKIPPSALPWIKVREPAPTPAPATTREPGSWPMLDGAMQIRIARLLWMQITRETNPWTTAVMCGVEGYGEKQREWFTEQIELNRLLCGAVLEPDRFPLTERLINRALDFIDGTASVCRANPPRFADELDVIIAGMV